MKKAVYALCGIILFAAFWFPNQLRAGITCTLPFTLQNNTTADATLVMANNNAIVRCFTRAAAAGVNSDITSLTALSTPIPISGGGSSVYIGGTSTGSANAQVVASATPISFSLTAGKRIIFVAGFSNTAATTLNVNAQGATNVYRRTQLGVSALVGGEIVAGWLVEAVYDGTQFQLISPPAQVGLGTEWYTTTAPAGWLLMDGTSYVRTAPYADLFAVIGTTYGAVDGSHFSVPDMYGRMTVMKDAASRITGICAAANTLGTICGQTAGTVAIAQTGLPNVTLSGTTPVFYSQPTNAHAQDGAITFVQGIFSGSGAGRIEADMTTTTTSINTGVTQTATTVLNGSLVVNKIIKY